MRDRTRARRNASVSSSGFSPGGGGSAGGGGLPFGLRRAMVGSPGGRGPPPRPRREPERRNRLNPQRPGGVRILSARLDANDQAEHLLAKAQLNAPVAVLAAHDVVRELMREEPTQQTGELVLGEALDRAA